MKSSIFYIILIFLAGCYNIEKEESLPEIKNLPDRWSNSEYENKYDISQIWPVEIDSTLYYLLNDFNNNNKNILLLELKEKISKTYHKVNSSNLYPEISLGAGIGKGKQNLSAFGLSEDFLNSDPEGEEDLSNESSGFISASHSLKVNTSWELDLWGRLKDSRKASFYMMNSELYNVQYAKISLKAQFIKLYLRGIFLNDRIKISEQNLQNLEKLKEISESRVLQGISNPDEIHIASANYYIYESKLIALKEQYSILKNNIHLMLGQYLEKGDEILYQYPCDILEINSNISTILLERRIDILSAKEKVLSSKSRLKSDKKIFFPNITLNASSGYASSDLENLINENFSVWNVGMNVLEPIFKGGEIKNSIKISEYNLKSSEIEYIKVAINAICEADNIIYRENNLKKIHQKVKKSKNEMEKAFKYAINSYELGLIDLVYLLNVQQQIYDISIEESKVHLDRYLNRVDLILSLGGNFDYE